MLLVWYSVQLNLDWNPFVIVARKLLNRVMSGADATSAQGSLTSGETQAATAGAQGSTVANAAGGAVAGPETQVMRWLEPGERDGERIAIVSYPRSGNSLMRGLLERITGVYTGCDTRPDRALSQELQQYGMKGEVGRGKTMSYSPARPP